MSWGRRSVLFGHLWAEDWQLGSRDSIHKTISYDIVCSLSTGFLDHTSKKLNRCAALGTDQRRDKVSFFSRLITD